MITEIEHNIKKPRTRIASKIVQEEEKVNDFGGAGGNSPSQQGVRQRACEFIPSGESPNDMINNKKQTLRNRINKNEKHKKM